VHILFAFFRKIAAQKCLLAACSADVEKLNLKKWLPKILVGSIENNLEQHRKARSKQPDSWSRCSGGSTQARVPGRKTWVQNHNGADRNTVKDDFFEVIVIFRSFGAHRNR
jgi:hypothetical protein